MIEHDYNLENLKNHMNGLLKKNLYKSRQSKIECCPICGCKSFIKYGFYKGIQRYKCKNDLCKKTFSLTTNSIWCYSKKPAEKWIEFLELMMEKRTLENCSRVLEISINTAFYWRHKVMNALMLDNIPNKISGNIHMTKDGVKENFKGNRHINKLERDKICIVASRGEEDYILVLPICKKFWSRSAFNEKYYNRIDRRSYLNPYLDRYIRIIAKKHNMGIEKNLEDDQLIKNFALEKKEWYRGFRGIATKYLTKYFCWFDIFYRRKKFNDINMIYDLVSEFSYITTKNIRIEQDES